MPTLSTASPASALNSQQQEHPALRRSDAFEHRHIGPSEDEVREMLGVLGLRTLEELTRETVPGAIRLSRGLSLAGLDRALGEHEAIERLYATVSENKVLRSYIGMGYCGTITPPVILRNIIENPGWYTQYTPYQAEISQGRLEALLNFQTMVSDLTALPLAGASLLDEATAAAEAMSMCLGIHEHKRLTFIAATDCHPQTLGVVRTRAEGLGIRLVEADPATAEIGPDVCGVLVQYPTTDGRIEDYRGVVERAHAAGALVVFACDLLALTLLTPPGELGADIAVGSAQRLGVPMGFGGPHAAFISTREEFVRRMPGRLIGVSRDSRGKPALRMAIQTREQHIRREKATSNICTAQALLAIMAGMYAVYHGPEGLRRIADRVLHLTAGLAMALTGLEQDVLPGLRFDTLRVRPKGASAARVIETAASDKYRMNFRDFGDGTVGITLDETADAAAVGRIVACFADAAAAGVPAGADTLATITEARANLPEWAARVSAFLTHPVFNTHHSEHEMLRYIFKLQGRDLSLAHSMIPLGSCTMKLNATSEMLPVTWRAVSNLHPFAPRDQTLGYLRIFRDLENWLAEITGFAAVSLQPNSGAAGEYAGLLVIRAYHIARGEKHRDVCLIPESAHGTNPASAVCAGFDVVVVKNTPSGDIDINDLRAKADLHRERLAALMVTYPSTYGVFEEKISEICAIVHERGGQVYMDGANMNAQVGLCRPGDIGADVCHLNLHKTFCIPHGGGGPGMGPIGVAAHLAPYLPGHPVTPPPTLADQQAGEKSIGPVSAAAYGSPSILTIPWMYIAMMGAAGLTRATQVAILNANYMAARLEGHYNVLYKGTQGRCAHEFIIDVRPFDKSAGIKPDDIAKRLMDYGFHAPTMSWPVPGTLMVEPTESESKAELDRFCEAMIAIREEIRAIEAGLISKADNPLKNAPHTMDMVCTDSWSHPYPREQAAFPLPWVRECKFWPSVGRVDNPYGDRNLVCVCPPLSDYTDGAAG
ncbi:MAG: aminomethyl-transferring glycine dehydrogenase [Phycisphaeraceae bacterium]|nr:aminomethyl-transferring glycine dehydrogenase [Phycisphaeraceae bacterium]